MINIKETKKNVVIYARFSSNKQNETSVEAQILECTRFCERTNRNIISTYVDKAKSAKTSNRPNFLKMITDSYKKSFEEIIVYSFDRFSRRKYDSVMYKHELLENGVRVVSISESLNMDQPISVVTDAVSEAYAEYYSLELACKVNRGMLFNASKGYFNGRSYPPWI